MPVMVNTCLTSAPPKVRCRRIEFVQNEMSAAVVPGDGEGVADFASLGVVFMALAAFWKTTEPRSAPFCRSSQRIAPPARSPAK